MASFYSVDRKGFLSSCIGNQVPLFNHEHIKNEWAKTPFIDDVPPLNEFLDLFSNGLSSHGFMYFINFISDENKTQSMLNNQCIEQFYEAIRQAHYPEKMSRLTATFGVKSIDQANKLASTQGFADNQGIYELESKNFFEADMNLLFMPHNGFMASYHAHKYWRGELSDNPNIEVLMESPIVVRRL